MADDGALEVLILDLLEFIGSETRPYAEVMEAWRTSCPALPVWETASQRGFIERQPGPEVGPLVSVTRLGKAFLQEHRAAS